MCLSKGIQNGLKLTNYYGFIVVFMLVMTPFSDYPILGFELIFAICCGIVAIKLEGT